MWRKKMPDPLNLCCAGLNRPDGSSIRFDKNSCVLLGEDLKPRASRVLHPLPRELRNTVFSKLLFLSDVIL
jgi:large subunit ribosomal protein L14